MLGVRSFLRLVKVCLVLGSTARLSLHSTALAMVWITQLCLERICRAGLPSQGICRSLKTDFDVSISCMAAVLLGSAVTYASLINDMSQEHKTGLTKFIFSTVKCNASRGKTFQHCMDSTVVSCLVVPKMRMSSITQSTPGKPS